MIQDIRMKNIILLLVVAGLAVVYFYTPATLLADKITDGRVLLKYCTSAWTPHCHWIWEPQHVH